MRAANFLADQAVVVRIAAVKAGVKSRVGAFQDAIPIVDCRLHKKAFDDSILVMEYTAFMSITSSKSASSSTKRDSCTSNPLTIMKVQ